MQGTPGSQAVHRQHNCLSLPRALHTRKKRDAEHWPGFIALSKLQQHPRGEELPKPAQSETPAQRCSTTPLWHMRKTAVDLGLSRFGLTAFNCRDRAPRPVGRLPCRHIVIFCRTECHQALESVLLQSRSLGHSSGCFSYFVPIVFYSPIAARES